MMSERGNAAVCFQSPSTKDSYSIQPVAVNRGFHWQGLEIEWFKDNHRLMSHMVCGARKMADWSWLTGSMIRLGMVLFRGVLP